MLGNGGGTRTIQPEFFTGFSRGGSKTFTPTGIGKTHDVRSSFAYIVFHIAGNIRDQHHSGAPATVSLRRVTHSF